MAQLATPPGFSVGTSGQACSGSSIQYGWPDANGQILKCSSNVWSVVSQTATAGGSNGQVQFNSSNALAGSSKLFWDNSNSRLGIGTNAPINLLDVYGSTGGGVAIGSGYAGTYTAPANGLLVQGNVGIGTIQPTSKLHVYGGSEYIQNGTLTINADPGASNNVHYSLGVFRHSTANLRGIQFGYLGTGASDGYSFIEAPGYYTGINFYTFDASGSYVNNMYMRYDGTMGLGGLSANVLNINSLNNVGIGTTAPLNKLDVSGGSVIGAGYIGTTTAPTNGLIVQGNVGIGTTAPISSLSNNGNVITDYVGNNTQSTGFNWVINSNGYVAGLFNASTGGQSNGLLIKTASNSSTNIPLAIDYGTVQNAQGGALFRVMGNGSVGIGTTNPMSMPQVNAGEVQIGSSGATCTGNNAGALRYSAGTHYFCNSSTWTAIGTSGNVGGAAGSNGQVQWNNSGALGASSNLFWDNTNNRLGIGTSAPVRDLEIVSTVTSGGTLGINSTATGGRNYQITSTANSSGTGGGNFGIRDNTAGGYRLIINSTGNVGIGTITPLNLLDVYGGSVIGAGYVGTTTAPTNGLIVQGNTGIGTATPRAMLDVGGNGNSTDFRITRVANGSILSISAPHGSPAVSTLSVAGTNGFTLEANGGAGFGSGMASGITFPANGLLVQGNVGIGTVAPANLLDVSGGVVIGTAYVGATTAPSNGLIVQGKVGLGSTSPTVALDVNGAMYGHAVSIGTTIVDWTQGNVQGTSQSCGVFSFSGMQDGGSYTLTVEGTTSGTCSFSNTDSPTLTFKMPSNHGATTASTMTLYHFTRRGTNVFVTWMPGY